MLFKFVTRTTALYSAFVDRFPNAPLLIILSSTAQLCARLVLRDQTADALAYLGVLALYSAVSWVTTSHRLVDVQVKATRAIRVMLGVRVDPLLRDAYYSGPTPYYNCSVYCFGVFLALLIQGEYFLAGHLFLHGWCFCQFLVSPNLNVRFWGKRLTSAAQALVHLQAPILFEQNGFRREIISRAMLGFIANKSFMQTMIDLLPLVACGTMKVGAKLVMLTFPLQILALVLIPMEIFGIRELSAQVASKFSKDTKMVNASKALAVVSFVIPIGSVLFGFNQPNEHTPHGDEHLFFQFVALLLLVFSVVCYFLGHQVDVLLGVVRVLPVDHKVGLLSQNYSNSSGMTHNPQHHVIPTNTRHKHNRFIMCATWILTASALLSNDANFFGLAVIVTGVFVDSVLVRVHPNLASFMERENLFLAQLAFFPYMLWYRGDHAVERVALLFSVYRMLLAYDDKPFHQVAGKCALVASYQIMLAEEHCHHVALFSMCCIFIMLALSIISQNGERFVRVCGDAEAFVDHAIKQKFDSLGTSLGYILDDKRHLTEATALLLTQSLEECRRCRSSCHLTAFARKFQAGLLVAQPMTYDLYAIVDRWSTPSESSACPPIIQCPITWFAPTSARRAAAAAANAKPPLPLMSFYSSSSTTATSQALPCLDAVLTSTTTTANSSSSSSSKSSKLKQDPLSSVPLPVYLDWNLLECLLGDMCLHARGLEITITKEPQLAVEFLVRGVNPQHFLIEIRAVIVKALGGRIAPSAEGNVIRIQFRNPVPPDADSQAPLQTAGARTAPTACDDDLDGLAIPVRRSSSPLSALCSPRHDQSQKLQQSRESNGSPPTEATRLPSCSSNAAMATSNGNLCPHESDQDSVSVATGTTHPGCGSTPQYIRLRQLSQPYFPVGERFALLDDNPLVRKSVSRLLFGETSRLRGDARESIVRGETKAEAIFFPQEITMRNISFAVIDENLEYEDETVKGTDLGVKARALGFQGCLILHSANRALEKTLHPAFDGFIEKTMDRDHFANQIVAIAEHMIVRI